ncbi:hypothetical protein [Vibrio sp. TBV020]|uniref:hypothetical protein n=1 Tax=Vibrio sp. TBV020 TaxID=3137398 RepID=UPI0038CDAA27
MQAFNHWDSLTTFELSDNDDYMRYNQFTSWIEDGNWYLKPIEAFNPEDGLIMHWLRVPDIPLALCYLMTHSYFSSTVAAALTMTIVPALYLVGVVAAVGFMTKRLSGDDASKIAMVMVLLSPIVSKFLPGAIDHHNIQLCLLAWIVALVPINREDSRQYLKATVQGGLIALSFWVGMENLPIVAIILGIMVLQGYFIHLHTLKYTAITCLSSSIFVAVFIVLNRPLNEYLEVHYDSISIVYLCVLVSGYAFCFASLRFFERGDYRKRNKIIRLIALSVVFLPVLIAFPFLVKGVFHSYPEVLKLYWLNHVTEAKPMLDYIHEYGFFSERNLLLFMLPALVAPYFLKGGLKLAILYSALFLSLVMPLFWQSRMVFASFIFSIPIQSALCVYFMGRFPNQLLRIVFMVGFMPWFMALVLFKVLPFSAESRSEEKGKVSMLSKVDVLIDGKIQDALILAPIPYGAPALVLTQNKIISAPYHRNINGNTFVIEVLSSNDMSYVKSQLRSRSVDFVMFGEDGASLAISRNSNRDGFINRLRSDNPPEWMTLVNTNEHGIKLYKVDKENI